MNISAINYVKFNNNINFGDFKPVDDASLRPDSSDEYISQKKSVMNQIRNYLLSVGIKAQIRENNSLEISDINKLPIDAIPITNMILQYTKKINGSVDFGKIGAENIGSVELLQGKIFGSNKFDFTGLEITGDIFVKQPTQSSHNIYRKLDNFEKMALLGGFTLL